MSENCFEIETCEIIEINEVENKDQFVYNLEVDETHNYFANNVLVSNCHCLKEAAASALLKILEEPPKTSMFVLCTTNPEKVLPTVRSRCQIISFRDIDFGTLSKYFEQVSKKEGVANIEAGSMEVISRAARGSVRDGLSILDSLIGRCGKSIEKRDVEDVVGCSDQATTFKLVKYICSLDKKMALTGIIKIVKSNGREPSAVFNSLLEMWHDLLLSKGMDITDKILFVDPKILEEWIKLRESLTTKEINRCLQTTSRFMTDLHIMPRADYMLDSLVISLIEGLSELRGSK